MLAPTAVAQLAGVLTRPATGNQLRLMQLGPSLHESSLPPGQTPSEQLNGVKAVHGLIITMVRVKMG